MEAVYESGLSKSCRQPGHVGKLTFFCGHEMKQAG